MSHEKTIRETDEMDLSADRLPTKHASLCNPVIGVPLRLASSSDWASRFQHD